MALTIESTALPDAPLWLERALTAEIVGGYFQISGNNARIKLVYGKFGAEEETEENILPPGSYNVGRSPDGRPLAGIRAQNATAGLPANLAGYFWDVTSPTLSFVGEVGAQAVSVVGVPVGSILAWGSLTAPALYRLCDGSAISRTTFADLFAVIGTLYGIGDGVTTFNVPDLRGRVPVGVATGGKAQVDILGDNDGRTLANRNVSHHHQYNVFANAGGNAFGDGLNNAGARLSTGDAQNQDFPAYQVVNWIIAAGV